MKKFIIGLGSLGAIIAPIATVVACGDDDDDEDDSQTGGTSSTTGVAEATFTGGTVKLTGTTLVVDVTSGVPKTADITKAAKTVTDYNTATEVKVMVNGVEGTGPITGSPTGQSIETAIIVALATDGSLANCIELSAAANGALTGPEQLLNDVIGKLAGDRWGLTALFQAVNDIAMEPTSTVAPEVLIEGLVKAVGLDNQPNVITFADYQIATVEAAILGLDPASAAAIETSVTAHSVDVIEYISVKGILGSLTTFISNYMLSHPDPVQPMQEQWADGTVGSLALASQPALRSALGWNDIGMQMTAYNHNWIDGDPVGPNNPNNVILTKTELKANLAAESIDAAVLTSLNNFIDNAKDDEEANYLLRFVSESAFAWAGMAVKGGGDLTYISNLGVVPADDPFVFVNEIVSSTIVPTTTPAEWNAGIEGIWGGSLDPMVIGDGLIENLSAIEGPLGMMAPAAMDEVNKTYKPGMFGWGLGTGAMGGLSTVVYILEDVMGWTQI